MICTIDANGNCERHGWRHIGHAGKLAVEQSEYAESIRKVWDGKRANYQPPPPRKLLRSLPMAKNCIYNLGKNGTAKAGCALCSTYACKIKGTVRLEHCAQECRQHVSKPYQLDSTPLTEFGNMQRWQEAFAHHENPVATTEFSTLPINGAWIRDPQVWQRFRKMIEQEIAKHG